MPAPRAVLIDIEKNNLDPKKEYKSIDKKGNLVDSKTKKNLVEKSGLVFLEQNQVLAAKKQEQKEEVQLLLKEEEIASIPLGTSESLDLKEELPQELETTVDIKETEEKQYFNKKQKGNKFSKA